MYKAKATRPNLYQTKCKEKYKQAISGYRIISNKYSTISI